MRVLSVRAAAWAAIALSCACSRVRGAENGFDAMRMVLMRIITRLLALKVVSRQASAQTSDFEVVRLQFLMERVRGDQ
jgi:hypothetical protein